MRDEFTSQVLVEGLQFPESPFWSTLDNCLYFVEWTGDRVYQLHEGQASLLFETHPGDGPCGLCQTDGGIFWVSLYSSGQVASFDRSGQRLLTINSFEGQPFKGPNDVALDSRGGLYFSDGGDFHEDWETGRPAGSLYYLSPAQKLLRVASNLCFPNGIALTPYGQHLYVNEHRQNQTLEYTIGAGGRLSNPKILYQYDEDCILDAENAFELGPDGIGLDGSGNLWIAHYGGGKLVQVSPNGIWLRTIRLPRGRRPTNVVFHPGENSLYVTEAELGCLYRINLNPQ